VSVQEAIVAGVVDRFHMSRKKACLWVTLITLIVGVIVCLGYNVLYFELTLPNHTVGQILDVLDYISNYCLMPIVALLTCLLVGWVVGPQTVIDEVTLGGFKFSRKALYVVMVKVVVPILLLILLLQSLGILSL